MQVQIQAIHIAIFNNIKQHYLCMHQEMSWIEYILCIGFQISTWISRELKDIYHVQGEEMCLIWHCGLNDLLICFTILLICSMFHVNFCNFFLPKSHERTFSSISHIYGEWFVNSVRASFWTWITMKLGSPVYHLNMSWNKLMAKEAVNALIFKYQ